MKNRLAVRVALAVCALTLSAFAAFAIPNLPPAEFEGQCGWQPVVAYSYNGANYWFTGIAMAWNDCQAALPEMRARVPQGGVITGSYCRSAKWCDM